MTRYPPQGPPASGSQSGESYGYQQPQYAQSEPNYGAYNSGEGQGYEQAPNYQQPQQYGGETPGSAQSYYGSNEQAYQQYPNERYSGYGEQTSYQAGPPPSVPHQPSPHMQSAPPPQLYGGQQYPPQAYPPYGQQQYPPQAPTYGAQGGDDVAAFRSHFEQPHGAVDPATSQALPTGAVDEGDRGLMGALAGGAAGAYGGHKVNHGFIGGIGGAVAGSMLEDAYKNHNKPDKKPKSRRGSHSSSSSSDSDDHHHHHHHHGREAPVAVAGNFHASSRAVRLEGNCILVAECADTRGHHQTSRLDLNDSFTNSGGRLCWARGGNFAASAKDIRLVDGGKALEAELGDGRGGWTYNKVWLDERITNEDGRLGMI
ncbi:hypothetical protein LTR85_007816 [Meristemomyces frigidus]|nr:hypothetical protein LTR85_007816 [Meristemomyces frigidus]